MLCRNCAQQTDESQSGLCQCCGRPLAQGTYAPPEGYAYHPESNLYYQSSTGYDINTGAYARQVIWFDPNSGEYNIATYGGDAPATANDTITTGAVSAPDQNNTQSPGQSPPVDVILPPPSEPPLDLHAPLSMPAGFVLDEATGRYYYARILYDTWVIIWYDEEKNDYTQERFSLYDENAAAVKSAKPTASAKGAAPKKPKKAKRLVPALLSLVLVLGIGFGVWHFKLYEYLPTFGTASSQAEVSSSQSPAASSAPEPSKPESDAVSDSPESSSAPEPPASSSVPDASEPVSANSYEIPTDNTGFTMNPDWFGRSMCLDPNLPNGKWENYDGTKVAYINHHTFKADFTLWLVISEDGKIVDYQCEMEQDESNLTRYTFKNSEADIIVDNFVERGITIQATIHGVSYSEEELSVIWDKDAIDDIPYGGDWAGGTQIQMGSYVCRTVNGSYMDLEYSPRITLRADHSFSFLINAGGGMDERYGTYSINEQEMTLHFDGITGGYAGADNTTATLRINADSLILDEYQFGLSGPGAEFDYVP